MVSLTAESEVLAELLWRATWQACVLTVIVLAVTTGLRRWITPNWRSVLWLVPAYRLLMLLVPVSTFSLFNLFEVSNVPPVAVDHANATSRMDVAANEQPESSFALEQPLPDVSTAMTIDASNALTADTSSVPSTTSAMDSEIPELEWSLTTVLIGVWIVGCVVAMVLWMRSHVLISRIMANGCAATDPKLVEICESRRRALRLRRKIQCVVVNDDIGPAVCGLFRPRILLPSSLIRELNVDELRSVMVHEIEHIRRWDGLCSLLGRLLTVIHWFNPLAYVIRRNLRHQIELAVDASTIAAVGENMRRSYGELLIQLAQRPSRLHGIAHMAAKRSNLRSRIDEIAIPAKASRVRSALAMLAAMVLMICGLTDSAPTQELNSNDQTQATSEADQDDDETPANAPPKKDATSRMLEDKIRRIHETPNWRFVDTDFIESIEARQAELRGTHMTVRGNVIDEQSEPIAGAFVVLRLPSNLSHMRRGVDGRVQDVFAVGWTDELGQFAFDDQPTPWFESGNPLTWEICVFAPGQAVESRKFTGVSAQIQHVTMPMTREYQIQGTIRDSEGKPIEQMEFAHVEIVNPYEQARFELSLLSSEIRCVLRTDERGRFSVGGLPPQRIISLVPIGVPGSVIRVATTPNLEEDRMIERDSPRAGIVYPYFEPTFETSIARPPNDLAEANAPTTERSSNTPSTRTVTVRVLNADGGAGVSGVGVGWVSNVDRIPISPGMQATDENGVAKLNIPQRSVEIFVGGRRYGFLTQYERISTGTREFAPTLARSEWVKGVAAGDQDIELKFEVRPVAPLKVVVQTEDGTPKAAELQVTRRGWGEHYSMPTIQTDDQGQANIPVRPVMFDIEITATTEDGMQGRIAVKLSRDFDDSESAIVTVK
ncbi:M56 family metallopeptidase [Rhodopirellula europaea]|uniref:M56 family metallopeptidase n=1 Tax=Rhodopirellula europaea TaxID=1263866 RepID=UPI003D2BB8F5